MKGGRPRKRKRLPRVIGNPADPLGMASRLTGYLEWLAVRNYSLQTVEVRREGLGVFIRWAAERGLNRPTEITKPILERYQRWLFHYRNEHTERPLSVAVQRMRLSHVRGFFRFLMRQNYLLYNPAADLELPRAEHRLPRSVMSAGEAEKVLALPGTDEPIGLRDRTILELLYSTGLRRTELVSLAVGDVDFEREVLLVRLGKGKKDRVVPVGERALVWLRRYLDDVRPKLLVGPDEGVLFLTGAGLPFLPASMTQLVSHYVREAALGKRGGCHIFRHTMATLMLENGADVRIVQEMLGHSELSSTQIYTHVAIRQLKAVHRQTHPSATIEARPARDAGAAVDERQLELFAALASEAREEETP